MPPISDLSFLLFCTWVGSLFARTRCLPGAQLATEGPRRGKVRIDTGSVHTRFPSYHCRVCDGSLTVPGKARPRASQPGVPEPGSPTTPKILTGSNKEKVLCQARTLGDNDVPSAWRGRRKGRAGPHGLHKALSRFLSSPPMTSPTQGELSLPFSSHKTRKHRGWKHRRHLSGALLLTCHPNPGPAPHHTQ